MKPVVLTPIPELADVPEQERNATVKWLLPLCHQQQTQLAAQAEQLMLQSEKIGLLKDEIAVLKGEKARPKIKPSSLNSALAGKSGSAKGKNKRRGRGKPSCKKTQALTIHDEKVIQPETIPLGAVFKGYKTYVVQELEITLKNTKYLRARYLSPTGEYVIGELPAEVRESHFGVQLRSYILSQYYQQHVPQGLILRQLREWGVEISSGQLNELIIAGHERFHEEKAALLRVGLAVSSHINVDDTGARHQGKNGYCTHIGNEWFAWFASTESKSRINFLQLLGGEHPDYIVDEVARGYMKQQKLPQAVLTLLSQDQACADKAAWEGYLESLGITSERHIKIATEGALAGDA